MECPSAKSFAKKIIHTRQQIIIIIKYCRKNIIVTIIVVAIIAFLLFILILRLCKVVIIRGITIFYSSKSGP